MSLIIGLDVGWSQKQRSCGVAMRAGGDLRIAENSSTTGRTQSYGQQIQAVALNFREVARSLAPAVRSALQQRHRVLIVTDAIVGIHATPQDNRRIDQVCSANGFFRRAQSYPATQQSGVKLSETLHTILSELCAYVGPIDGASAIWTPFFGGDLPEQGIVVVETNPTTTMALCLEPADPDSLPTRRVPRVVGDRTFRAKSDWYWFSGAGRWAGTTLGADAIAEERHHERLAGLWCLALASELDRNGQASLLGDGRGVYLTGPIHTSWRQDIEGVLIHECQLANQAQIQVRWPENARSLVVENVGGIGADGGDGESQEEEAQRGDRVWVRFTDSGGLALTANPWLENIVDFPARICLRGKASWIPAVIEPFDGANGAHQFKIQPTVMAFFKHCGRTAPPTDARDFGVWGSFDCP